MSGIVGHITYAVLGARAAAERRLPVAPLFARHLPSYLAGCYLAADIMTLPGGVCNRCGGEFGYGNPPEKCPEDGAPLTRYYLEYGCTRYSPQDIHRMFYGRSHLRFGWSQEDEHLALTWDQLPDYLAAAVKDAIELYGPGERHLAYLFGWMTHVVGDPIIKSVEPRLDLHLLNGTYTPQNRPIQDLVSFHEVGRKELGLDWAKLMNGLVETPEEPVQAHFMRLTEPRGRLAEQFSDGWRAGDEGLLLHLMQENRRYQRIRNKRLLEQLELRDGPDGPECDPALSETTGGLTYSEMVKMCEEACFRRALQTIGEAIAVMFERVLKSAPPFPPLP